MSAMIQAEGLTKYYGRVLAVDDVSFSVDEGEVVAFLGPNAAGKTTTMRILTGFTPATMGSAAIAGHEVAAESLAARQHIGYMPEVMALYPEFTVQQYLTHFAKLRGVESHGRDERIEEISALCGVEEVADTHCGKLSKGYRQRVGLAQALVHDPDVLILDEPTIGLDPVQIRETRRLIKDLGKEHTVMLSTHILPEAQMTCERVIIIANGQIVAVDTPANLAAQIRKTETLYLKVREESSRAPRTIRDMADVIDVQPADETRGDGKAYLVSSEMGMDIREQLSTLAIQRGWGLLEMRPVAVTLEDVYMDLTTEEEGV